MKPSREEMLAVTMNQKLAKQGAKSRKLAEARDVNTMPDPKTYAAVMGMLGTSPDEMGFSAMHPQYKEIMDVAAPAYYAGIAAQLAPLVKPAATGVKAAGKMAGQALNDRLLSGQSLTPGFNTPAPIMFAAEPGKAAGKTGPFFSALDEAAANLPRSKGTGKEFMTELRKQPSVKKAEIDDRKLAEIEAAPKMTKDEFLAMLKDRPAPKVNEIVIEDMGGVTPEIKSRAYRMLYDSARNNVRRNNPHMRPELIEERAQKLGDRWVAEGIEMPYFIGAAAEELGVTLNRAQYKDYTFPGGKNYREVLLNTPAKERIVETAIPSAKKKPTVFETSNGQFELLDEMGEPFAKYGTREEAEKAATDWAAPFTKKEVVKDKEYQSPHWDDPNVLAHMRVSDRTGPKGEKILHVEEIQSDWHQEGRRKGYGPKIEKTVEAYYETKSGQRIPVGFGKTKEEAEASIDIGWKNLVDIKYETIERKIGEGVPDAPFKKNWHELATKKAMDMAIEGGYDKVVITPGAEQAKRYRLSNVANSISYHPDDAGRGMFLNVFGKDNNVIYSKLTSEDELPRVIGKDAAAKLLEQTPVNGNRVLEGLNLDVGGEGMRGFYDQILPAYINKEYGKYGAKVGEFEILHPPKDAMAVAQYPGGESYIAGRINWPDFLALNPDVAKDFSSKLHSIDITPEMREAIKSKGQPFYQAIGAGTAGAAATDFDPEAYDKGGEVKATPVKNRQALGMSKALQAVHGFASKPFGYNNPPGEMISEFLGIPATARTLERMGYGEPQTTGKGMTTKPRDDLMDALMSVAPLAPATKNLPVGAVVKPKGGNWIDEGFPSMLQPLKTHPSLLPPEHALKMLNERYTPEALAAMPEDLRRHAEHSIKQQKDKLALDKWVDRNLTKYIKNEMGTEGDPIRKLAEQGILHKNPELLTNDLTPQAADRYREMVGGKQMAKSDAAKAWENASDVAIEPLDIEHFSEGRMLEGLVEPWMKKAPAGTKVYGPAHEEVATDLGFDHIVDILRQDLAAGRIRPEQLSKVSVEQAVRRTYDFDQEMAKKMREAQIKATEGMPIHKEYPEGYKWVELKANKNLPATDDGFGNMSSPGYDELEKALKYEGDTMGHCVGGYCDDVYEGRSRIYSLRDAKGEPHVTVEVEPRSLDTKNWFFEQPNEIVGEIRSMVGNSPTSAQMADAIKSHPKYIEDSAKVSPAIVQIKGKQNRAPREEYLPYVQDFVRGGQWSNVGDFQNTGLKTLDQAFPNYEDVKHYSNLNPNARYVTQAEIDAYYRDNPPLDDGMKHGGEVKMGIGGLLGKGAKAAQAEKARQAMKASEALGQHEGKNIYITQADRTKVGEGFLGGPGFSGLQHTSDPHREAMAAWGVKNPGTAKTILGGDMGKDPLFSTMIGSPTQHQSNQMVFDKMYRQFKNEAKKCNLSDELRFLINDKLAKAVDKEGKNIFPPDVDILGKNFHKMADTFDRRSIAGHLMGGVGVGGKKGQIIDYDKIIRQTTDPALIDAPSGAIGNRLFTLSGEVIQRPDLHPAFPTIMTGEDMGLAYNPVPRELFMQDFINKVRAEKGRDPGYMDYTRGRPPSQFISEDWLTKLQKEGHKKGGLLKVKRKK